MHITNGDLFQLFHRFLGTLSMTEDHLVAGHGGHAGIGALQRHEQGGFQLLLGAGQLFLGDTVGQEFLQFLPDEPQGGILSFPAQGHIDAQNAGVLIQAGEAVDGIAQAALLPHPLEQTAAHARAQNVVEGSQHIAVGVIGVQAGEHQQQMILLNVFFLYHGGLAIAGLGHGSRLTGRQNGKSIANRLQIGIRKTAAQGDDGVSSHILLAAVILQRLRINVLQGAGSAQNGPTQRLTGVDGGRQDLGHQIFGRIFIHADLFHNHAPLQIHILGTESRVQHHVAQQFSGLLHMGVQRAGIVAGVFLGGEGVHLTANGIEILCQIGGGTAFGALEHHVFNVVRDAGQTVGLVAAAVFHPDAQGTGAHVLQLFMQYPDTVVQNDFFYHRNTSDS